jgi:hypothetical protein
MGSTPYARSSPASKLTLKPVDGVPVFEVAPQGNWPVVRCEIYYSVDPEPRGRFWRSTQIERNGDTFRAKLPLHDTKLPLFAFANVFYTLVSALSFHGLTTQLPYEVWIAIERGTWTPISTDTKLRVFHFSGESMTSGIEAHSVEGVRVQVYSVPKTIADCFKFRNKVGMDVAIEALREGWRARRFTMDELWR